MSDDCITSDDSRCTGTGVCGNFCLPNHEQRGCVLSENAVRNCPRDTRIFLGGSVQAIEKFKWLYDKLSPAAQALSGKRLEKSDVEGITVEDRRNLCGAYPNDPCDMKWNEEKKYAECVFGPADCSACQYTEKPIQCIAKNKCSGVICL